EQAALVHGGNVDPVDIRFEAPLDLGRVDADVVVVVGAPQRVDAVGAKRHFAGRARGGCAQAALEGHEAALDRRLVADLDVVARQTGIGAHGPAVAGGRLPVVEHGLEHERGQLVRFGTRGGTDAVAVVLGNVDGRATHDLERGLVELAHRYHDCTITLNSPVAISYRVASFNVESSINRWRPCRIRAGRPVERG